MVLAQRVELYVAHHYHLRAFVSEYCLPHYVGGISASVPRCHIPQGAGSPQRCLSQTFAGGILPNQLEDGIVVAGYLADAGALGVGRAFGEIVG